MQALAPYPTPVSHALVPSVVRIMLHAFLEIDAIEVPTPGGEGWLPTAANINVLPESYVHDLEARCDPAHDVQKMAAHLSAYASCSKHWLRPFIFGSQHGDGQKLKRDGSVTGTSVNDGGGSRELKDLEERRTGGERGPRVKWRSGT
jgi:hypothetical protein